MGGALADPRVLDFEVAALIKFRDQPGGSAAVGNAHGSGFDRVRAFSEGYQQGAEFCAGYSTNFPALTEVPFRSAQEAQTNGNLPYAEIMTAAVANLNVYYTLLSSTFPGPLRVLPLTGNAAQTCNKVSVTRKTVFLQYCSVEKVVVYDEQSFQQLYSSIGDAAPASLLGLAWAEAARQGAGEPADTGGSGLYQQSCLTGSWLLALSQADNDPNAKLSLSPGDLDKAIGAFVQVGSDPAKPGNVFKAVAALRNGFVGGAAKCKLGTA